MARSKAGIVAAKWIIFSKDRPLQLHSLLRSLFALSDVRPEHVSVLCRETEGHRYPLIGEAYPGLELRFEDHFLADVHDLAAGEEEHDFVGFMVDDLIVARPFSQVEMVFCFRETPGLESFSLRMGRNLAGESKPTFEEIRGSEGGEILLWETASGLERHWNYFWDLSSSLYPRATVVDYFSRLGEEVDFPNPLESKFYQCYPHFLECRWKGKILNMANRFRHGSPVRRMACYSRSRCFTQGLNLVANRRLTWEDTLTVAQLNRLYDQGYLLNHEHLGNAFNPQPNAGFEFVRFRAPDGEVIELDEVKRRLG